jgi:hypothetical protein
MSSTNHISQKIAKDSKTNLGHKGAALGQPLDRAQRSDGPQGYLFVIFVTFCADVP